MTTLELPKMRRDQWRIIQHPAKVKVLTMGRRWGKTVLGGTVALATSSQGGSVAWGAPSYKNTRPLWRMVESALGKLVKSKIATLNRAEMTVKFSNGGLLSIYSMDNHESILGESFDLVILDECARLSPEAWYNSVMPTLADRDGEAILISTPKGLNWFHDVWLEGRRDGKYIASFQAPTSDNPIPSIRQAFERVQALIPERSFKQEWLAEFIENAGTVFRNVKECVYTGEPDTRPSDKYVIGVDLAKTVDYTVFTVINVRTKQVVFVDRFHDVNYTLQVERLDALRKRFNNASCVIETNNIGVTVIELAYRKGITVFEFTTTNATKNEIISRLIVAFEQNKIRIPHDEILIGELLSYEVSETKTAVTYNAPSGKHDDCVMSLAFAWQAVDEISSGGAWL
jgi:phage terminase large subunit-like protein